MTSEPRRFAQVDVFGSRPMLGNPVAVVVDADGIDDDELQRFARWTNLSETTFLLPPTGPSADYRVRIFTPGGELSFAGHPTLGSAHAWLEAGGVAAVPGTVVQECGIGQVRLRDSGGHLAFAAPSLVRSGAVDGDTIEAAARALRIGVDEILSSNWVDNGPGWFAVELRDAAAVLALEPDFTMLSGFDLGVFGFHPDGSDALYEVRGFAPDIGVPEDPVTGSLNAGLASWLLASGRVPDRYLASQGAALGRAGRVHIERADGEIWVGGATRTVVAGTVTL
ncbi:MAG TPA: PhzF family phenazine biosynthesis protein [Humibacter sp.]|jgi:PhzF family phenazine biosynthesis protein|nr:PhzF family phenazine biosynthesis protein [Humibacter sp.]